MLLHKILRIIDSNDNLVVKYEYNAYGNILNISGDIRLWNEKHMNWNAIIMI